MKEMLKKINEAEGYILDKITEKPEIGMILGSGLGILADEIKNPVKIKYEEIPHFPQSTVEGHAGQFVIGELICKIVLAMQGRFHYYEGYTMKEITFPVRLMNKMDIKQIIVTNAAGGVNEEYTPGDLMIIEDHINFAGDNPLMGKNFDELGPRFPDTSTVYNKELREKIFEIADQKNISLKQGVYLFNSGPTYETPAEVRMARVLGADAVGMSTVPEVIVAAHAGIKVVGISCITNMAAGILDQPLYHGEVVETANKIKSTFISLVKEIVNVM